MVRLLLRLLSVALIGPLGVSARCMTPAHAGNAEMIRPASTGGFLATVTAFGLSADVSSTSSGADLPSNVAAPQTLQPVLSTMWNHSPTFRRQCARIRAETQLAVRLYTAALASECSGRAATRIGTRGPHMMEATVYLPGLHDAIELIAHEFEHILEHLDGVDLPHLARLAPATVWRTGDGMFETQRATVTGRLVAAEVGPSPW